MRSSKPTPKAQSEAPSVRDILTRLVDYAAYEAADNSNGLFPVPPFTITTAEAKINRLIEQAEINLLRDTADGFESVLTTEFEKGGKAAIKALRRMADHKEKALSNNLSKEDGK